LSLFRPGLFDLVITDLCMKGMSGLDLARALKETDPRVRIILCSGWALQQRSEELEEAGVHVVLQKPILVADLERAIGRARESLRDRETRYYFSGCEHHPTNAAP
jgi:CheY-like chemotaxis protein